MAVNKKKAIVARNAGNVRVLWVDFDCEDNMICFDQDQRIVVPPREGQFEHLLHILYESGMSIQGCFNCRYFAKGGMADNTSYNGICLQGKEGVHASLDDMTTAFSSCDAYEFGELNQQAEQKAKWSRSLRRGGV